MHSSGMHTARLLTVSHSICRGGVCLWSWGVSATPPVGRHPQADTPRVRGRHPPGQTPTPFRQTPHHPWVDTSHGQTHTRWVDTPLGTPCPVHARTYPPTKCMQGYTPCPMHARIHPTVDRQTPVKT